MFLILPNAFFFSPNSVDSKKVSHDQIRKQEFLHTQSLYVWRRYFTSVLFFFIRDFKRVPQENLGNLSEKRIMSNPKSSISQLKNVDNEEELCERRKDVLRMNQIYGEYEDIMMTTESSNIQSMASIIFFYLYFVSNT